MNDEDLDDTTGSDAEPTTERSDSADVDVPDRRPRSPYRTAGFATARAVVVLAVAAVGYQAVIPVTHVVRTRLAGLVVSEPGVAGYNVKPSGAAEQSDSQTQLAAVTAAAKRSPNDTGVYSIEWMQSASDVAGLVVLLLPTDAQATETLSQVRTQQMAATSDSANGLTRRSTFAVDGVPGSAGALFAPSAPSKSPGPSLVVTAFRSGRVVALSEVLSTAHTQSGATTLAVNEYSHLRRVVPGFSLKVVKRPMAATALWAAAAVALALLVALGPIGRRRLARRRQQRLEEELSHRVVVHGQVITKRRR